MAFISPRLNGDPALIDAGNNRPALAIGANGKAVRIFQRALIDLGFEMPRSTPNGTPDGIFGAETEVTTTAFQTVNGLTVDGVAGRETLTRLDQILSAVEQTKQVEDDAAGLPFPVGKWFIT